MSHPEHPPPDDMLPDEREVIADRAADVDELDEEEFLDVDELAEELGFEDE